MDLIVQLALNVALALHEPSTGAETDNINEMEITLKRHGVSIRPQHPGEKDPTLARYFVIEVSDKKQGESIRAELISLPYIEAAYIMPDAELP